MGKKARHSYSADKYNLIELSDLIGFGYGLSDTKDGLKCWRMGFPLLKRIQVSDPGPMNPLVYMSTRKFFIFICVIVLDLNCKNMRRSRKFCQRGSNSDNVFFFFFFFLGGGGCFCF